MSSQRQRIKPSAGSLFGSRPPATAAESELILATGTMPEKEPDINSAEPHAKVLGAVMHWVSAAELQALNSSKAFVFALPAEMPAAGETFNWDFLATSALVFFLAPNPFVQGAAEVQADAFHSTHALLSGYQFANSSRGISFPAPEGFLVPDDSTIFYTGQVQPMLDAFIAAQKDSVAAAAAAMHATPLVPVPAAPTAGTALTTPPTLGPPSQPILAGFLVKDREGRQYSCLTKTEPVACITKLSAATRLMSPERFHLFFEHVVIDMERVETRLTKHGHLAQSPSMPDGHPYKSLGKSEGLANLPLRSPKHVASFRQFLLCDLRAMDQSVVGWWCFCPTSFKAWEQESTVAGREQLRLCLLGMQEAMAAYHDALFGGIWERVIEEITHVNKPLRYYTDVFIAVQLWRLICLPYADAMDERVSSIDPTHAIATPADNCALIKKSISDSMAGMIAGTGVWAEKKPHFDFMDKEAGLFKQIVWPTKAAVPKPPVDSAGKKRKAEKAGASKAKKVAGAVGGAKPPPKKGPCVYHLAGQLKLKIGTRLATCGTDMLKTNGVCHSGWHCDIASMTRAQCEKVATDSTWVRAAVLLAGIKAADAKCFAP